MQIEVYDKSKAEKTILLSLGETNGSVCVHIVDESGTVLNDLCRFMPDGYLHLMTNVNEEFGFQLDEDGRIKVFR